MTEPGAGTDAREARGNGFANILRSLGNRLAPAKSADYSKIRVKFLKAGIRREKATTLFWGAKLLLAVCLPLFFLMIRFTVLKLSNVPLTLALEVVSGLIGYYLPDFLLQVRIDRRKAKIQKALPDALDLMVVCVEAGMGMDAANHRVSREIQLASPELSDELALLNLELRAGKARQDALRNLAVRTDLETINSLVTLLKAGQRDEAAQQFQTILDKTPRYAPAREGLGRAMLMQNNVEAGKAHFLQALALDDRLWRAHNYLGTIYDREKRWEKAVAAYKAAIALRPRQGALHNNLGMSYLLAGQDALAVEAFQSAITHGFARAKAYNNLGVALARLGRHEAAFEAFKKAGGEPRAYNNLGCIYMKEGRFDKAVASFEKAIAHLQKAISLQDRSTRFHNNLARAYRQTGQKAVTAFILSGRERQAVSKAAQPDACKDRDSRAMPDDTPAVPLWVTPRIEIANGNGVRDMARKLTDVLHTKGFHLVKPVNAEHFGYAFTQILYPAGRLPNARFLAREFAESYAGRLVEDDRRSDTIDIIIGKDFTLSSLGPFAHGRLSGRGHSMHRK